MEAGGDAPPPSSVSDRTGTGDPRRWRALALLGTAFFMVILDGTIVITALPVIGSEFAMSTGSLQWVISAYLICSVASCSWAVGQPTFSVVGGSSWRASVSLSARL